MEDPRALHGKKVNVTAIGVAGNGYTGIISERTSSAYLVLYEAEKISSGGVTHRGKPGLVIVPWHLITAPIEIPD